MLRAMQPPAPSSDPRTRRTRQRILRALTQLATQRRYDSIRIEELVAASGVGRSTFYEHFGSKDAVLLAAMEPILLPLANAAAGRGARAQLRMMAEHLWEQRAAARILLDSRVAPRLTRALGALIEARIALGDPAVPSALLARAAAAGQLALLRMWLGGEAPASPDAIALQLMAFSRLVRPADSG